MAFSLGAPTGIRGRRRFSGGTLSEINIVPLVEQIEQTNVPFGEIIFVDSGFNIMGITGI